jgi:sugar phosphate permease
MDEKPASAPQASSYSWYVLVVLVLVYIINFIDRQILSILAEDIKADLGLTDADLGFLFGAAFAVFYALFGIPLGRLADNWNRKKLLSIGLTLWSAMTALSGLAQNQVTLSLARMGVGVGEATASPTAYSLISDYFPKLFVGTLPWRRGIAADRGKDCPDVERGLARWRSARPGRVARCVPGSRHSRAADGGVGSNPARTGARGNGRGG